VLLLIGRLAHFRHRSTGNRAKDMADRKYWFTARSHGWGWGLPCAWQGWVVYAIAFALLLGGPFLFSPFRNPVAFQIYTWTIVVALVLVCWRKGAPPGPMW